MITPVSPPELKIKPNRFQNLKPVKTFDNTKNLHVASRGVS
jgi:hypothetical protein